MSKNLIKVLSIFISFCLILEQSAFAQAIDLSHYFARNPTQTIPHSDKFRPLHLRYISYDNQANDFKILLDKGDFFNQKTERTLELEQTTQELMKYFFIGLSLPNEKFWVNLRPDSPDNILDPDLEKTDIGRIFLEADLQLKKDTASFTSPQNPGGKAYWDKLYKKAGELFGSENITIPTITRPWIVPNEIIIREAPDNAYIYKATLKVMLEEDYLKSSQLSAVSSQQYNFQDPRLKELNEYSTQLIRETIIPKLTYEVNTSKRYASLRQVYYSLILAQWFKQKYGNSGSIRAPGARAPVNSYVDQIDSGNLVNLASREPYDKQAYFQQYQKSFKDGEYNLQDTVYTPMGQSVRRYMSGGGNLTALMANSSIVATNRKDLMPAKHMSSPVKVDANMVFSPIRFPELPVLSSSEEQVFHDAVDKGRKLFSKLLAGRIALFNQENISFPEKMSNRCKVKRLRNYSFKGEQAYLVELPNSDFAVNRGINIIAIVNEDTNKITRVYLGNPKKVSPAVAFYSFFNKNSGKPAEFSPNENGEDFVELKEGYIQEADSIKEAIIKLLDSGENVNKLADNDSESRNSAWEILEAKADKLELNNMSVHSMVNIIERADDRSVFLLENWAGNLEKISDFIIDLSGKPYEIGLSVIELPDNRIFFILAKGNKDNNDPLPGYLNGFTPWIRMYFHTYPPNERNDAAHDNFASIRSSGDVRHFHWAAYHNINKGLPGFFILHQSKGETALAEHKIEAPLKNLEGNSASGEVGEAVSMTNEETKKHLNDVFQSVLSSSSAVVKRELTKSELDLFYSIASEMSKRKIEINNAILKKIILTIGEDILQKNLLEDSNWFFSSFDIKNWDENKLDALIDKIGAGNIIKAFNLVPYGFKEALEIIFSVWDNEKLDALLSILQRNHYDFGGRFAENPCLFGMVIRQVFSLWDKFYNNGDESLIFQLVKDLMDGFYFDRDFFDWFNTLSSQGVINRGNYKYFSRLFSNHMYVDDIIDIFQNLDAQMRFLRVENYNASLNSDHWLRYKNGVIEQLNPYFNEVLGKMIKNKNWHSKAFTYVVINKITEEYKKLIGVDMSINKKGTYIDLTDEAIMDIITPLMPEIKKQFVQLFNDYMAEEAVVINIELCKSNRNYFIPMATWKPEYKIAGASWIL